MGRRFRAALKAGGFYALWYPSRMLPAFGRRRRRPGDRGARDVLRAGVEAARGRLFRAMASHGTAIEREQVLLGRFVDVGTEIFALSASCSRRSTSWRRGRSAKR